MSERAIKLDAGFSTADAEYPALSLKDHRLDVTFVDWREQVVNLRFDNAVAVRWQEVATSGPETRDDECYEILDSCWVEEHYRQGARSQEENLRHFRLCFNACGTLDVLAGSVPVRQGSG